MSWSFPLSRVIDVPTTNSRRQMAFHRSQGLPGAGNWGTPPLLQRGAQRGTMGEGLS